MLYYYHLVNIPVARTKNVVILASFLFLTPCIHSSSKAFNPQISTESFLITSIQTILAQTLRGNLDLQLSSDSFYLASSLSSTQH